MNEPTHDPVLRDIEEILGYRLSAEQSASVMAPIDRPLTIAAGAGAGKTTVMAVRVVWAVATEQVEPERVLGLTFTNKAAAELSTRVRVMLGQLGLTAAVPGSVTAHGEPVISTYHSFAHSLVAEHGLRIGVEPSAELVMGVQIHQLAEQVVRSTARSLTGIPSSSPQRVTSKLVELDAGLAEHDVATEQLREWDETTIEQLESWIVSGKPCQEDRRYLDTCRERWELSHLVDELRQAKRDYDVVDFADLMRFGAQLAADHAVAADVRDRYRMVLLDEYQDTSVVQSRILAGLFGRGHGVTAVGDTMQAIYGWRGASAGAMRKFRHLFAATDSEPVHQTSLTVSRRCAPRILAAANDVSASQRNQDDSVVRLTNPEGAPQKSLAVPTNVVRSTFFLSDQEERDWVADSIRAAIDGGVAPEEIAVLLRRVRDFEPMAQALAARSVPSQTSQLEGLLAQPEVADTVAVIRALADPSDNPAVLRLLTSSRWRIGPRDLAILGRRAAHLAGGDFAAQSQESGVDARLEASVAGTDPVDVPSLLEALEDPGTNERYAYSPEASGRFLELAGLLARLRGHVDEALPDFVNRVIVETGVETQAQLKVFGAEYDPSVAVIAHDRGLSALASLREAALKFRDATGFSDLMGFVRWVRAHETESDPGPEIAITPVPGAVNILTVHKAKGLEWSVVAVPTMNQGTYSGSRVGPRYPFASEVVPHPLRGDVDELPVLQGFGSKAHKEYAKACRNHQEAEDQRLVYVAITRAADMLLTSGHQWAAGLKKSRQPSRFLMLIQQHAENFPDDSIHDHTNPDSTNPLGEAVPPVPWPPPIDTAAQARKHAAAALLQAIGQASPASGSLLADLPDSSDLALENLTPGEADEVAQWEHDIDLLLAARDRRSTGTESNAPIPDSLSASDVMRLAEDRASFVADIARPMPRPPMPAAERGTRFHDWVEGHYGQRPLFDTLPGEVASLGDEPAPLTELQRNFEQLEYASMSPYGIEVPFTVVIDGTVIKGRIDAVFQRGERWEVVDWKTNRAATADPLQLAIYRVAWASTAGVDPNLIDGVFVYVATGEVKRYSDLPDVEALARVLAAPEPP